jgi:hypothetical protein
MVQAPSSTITSANSTAKTHDKKTSVAANSEADLKEGSWKKIAERGGPPAMTSSQEMPGVNATIPDNPTNKDRYLAAATHTGEETNVSASASHRAKNPSTTAAV